MVIKIRKLGDSLGLRIPKSIARAAGVEEGSEVDISLDGDRIVVRPLKPARYQLADLVSGICKDNIHEEITTGDDSG